MIGSGFGVYILSIVGAVVLMTVADIIMPEGQTSKYIKSALSIFLILIIISPIANIASGNIDIGNVFNNDAVQVDYSFTQKLNVTKAEALERGLERHLKDKGYLNVKVNILYTGNADGVTVDFVHIDLTKLVFNGENQHINIIYEIKENAAAYFKIAIERVFTYGAH